MNNNRNHNGLSRGLGDSIARFTRSTGISNLAQMGARALGKKDCGCKKRRDTLNKFFPYNNK